MTKFDELVDIITKKKNKSEWYDSISSTDSEDNWKLQDLKVQRLLCCHVGTKQLMVQS